MCGKRADTSDAQVPRLTFSDLGNLYEGVRCLAVEIRSTYRSRAHLAEMIYLLGPPPPSFLARGNLTQISLQRKIIHLSNTLPIP